MICFQANDTIQSCRFDFFALQKAINSLEKKLGLAITQLENIKMHVNFGSTEPFPAIDPSLTSFSLPENKKQEQRKLVSLANRIDGPNKLFETDIMEDGYCKITEPRIKRLLKLEADLAKKEEAKKAAKAAAPKKKKGGKGGKKKAVKGKQAAVVEERESESEDNNEAVESELTVPAGVQLETPELTPMPAEVTSDPAIPATVEDVLSVVEPISASSASPAPSSATPNAASALDPLSILRVRYEELNSSTDAQEKQYKEILAFIKKLGGSIVSGHATGGHFDIGVPYFDNHKRIIPGRSYKPKKDAPYLWKKLMLSPIAIALGLEPPYRHTPAHREYTGGAAAAVSASSASD